MPWKWTGRKNALLLDIGTNGEMAAGGADGFLVTSAAAGPVFEGGNISCGVAGVPGAVTEPGSGERSCRHRRNKNRGVKHHRR